MATSIARRRFDNQFLASPAFTDPVSVVRTLGAVQAQDYPNAKWAIALRTTGLRDADVERAFASGALLRTHVLRPTWHFVLPEDARWMLELTAPRVRQGMAFFNRYNELDARTFRRSHNVLERALRDGAQLTRAELAEALRRARIDVPTGERVTGMLLQAELDRVVISGARRGKQFTYALFDERVPPPSDRPRDRDESLRDLATRYFTTRGPATVHDYAWWSGLTVADAKRGIEICGRLLQREDVDGVAHWSVPAARASTRAPRVAHLLPNYDEYFVGFKDRSAFSERLRRTVPKTRVNALIGHIVVVNGQLVGGWRRPAGAADVDLRLLARLTGPEKRLVERAIERFRRFLGVGA